MLARQHGCQKGDAAALLGFISIALAAWKALAKSQASTFQHRHDRCGNEIYVVKASALANVLFLEPMLATVAKRSRTPCIS